MKVTRERGYASLKQQQMTQGWTESASEHNAETDEYFTILDLVAWSLGYGGYAALEGCSSAVSKCICARDSNVQHDREAADEDCAIIAPLR